MFIKWTIIILLTMLILLYVAGAFVGRKDTVRSVMDYLLYLVWGTIGAVSVVAAAAAFIPWWDLNVYKGLGLEIADGSIAWTLFIAVFVIYRAILHVQPSMRTNLPYFSTIEFLFTLLILMGVIDVAGKVKVTKGSFAESAEASMSAAASGAPAPVKLTTSTAGSATIKVEKAYIYSKPGALITRRNGQPSYLVKNQNVIIIKRQDSWVLIRYGTSEYWIANTSI